MKKLMKFTAVLASAAMLCGSCPAVSAVDDLYYFGFTDNGVFQQMQLLDDSGWLQSYVLQPYQFDNADENTPYYICTYHRDEVEKTDPQYYICADAMYLAVRQENKPQYVLRSDVDYTAAEQQAKTIVQKYFPGQTPFECRQRAYLVEEPDETMRTAEIAADLMRDLSKAGLISEFYSWGETAQYIQIEHGFLTAYNASGSRNDKENGVTYDWTAIEAWVRAQHPECEFVCITDKNSELRKKMNIGYLWDDTFYAVIPPEDIPFADHFALAMELYRQFGLQPNAGPTPLESSPGQMTGQNNLTISGDANLDCAVDVSDAVLVSRFAAEDREAVITDQGRANADVTHDGNVDAQDCAKLLQFIAKKIGYQEMEGTVPAEQNISTPAVPDNTDPAEDYAFNVQCFRVGWQDGSYPQTQVITSLPALEAFLNVYENGWETEAPRCYTKEWFQTHKLLAVILSEGSGSVSHEVTAVSAHEVKINRYIPEVGTCDMAEWLMLIELDRDADIADDLRVEFTVIEPESESYPFTVQGNGIEWRDDTYPKTKVIRSLPELEAYRADNPETVAYIDPTVFQKYTEEWFRDNKLLIVVLSEISGSISHKVTAVSTDAVSISRYVPEVITCDMARWHYLIELDQSAHIADNIRVYINTYEQQG